jgi:hypothetical protein
MYVCMYVRNLKIIHHEFLIYMKLATI